MIPDKIELSRYGLSKLSRVIEGQLNIDEVYAELTAAEMQRRFNVHPELVELLDQAAKRISFLEQYTEGKVDTTDLSKINSTIKQFATP